MSELLFENELAIVTIIKNESKYIQEWLDYHYRIGVDKFYIYNNDSDDIDKLMNILQPWINAKVVELENASGTHQQMIVYSRALQDHRYNCRYMCILDLDEFIFVKNGQSLLELVNEHFSESYQVAGFGINWRMFGTSGKQFYEPIDVIERFTIRGKDSHPANNFIKSIVNPRRGFYMNDPHSLIYFLDSFCFDESKRYIQAGDNPSNECKKIQVNHYFTKSVDEYREKINRGCADTGATRSEEEFISYINSLNDVEDTGLRDLYRILKQQPLPPVKDHSERKILSNIKKMMQPFLNPTLTDEEYSRHSELFLTCFFLVNQAKSVNEVDKSNIKKLLMECLNKALSKKINTYEINLVLSAREELFTADFKMACDIFKSLQRFFPIVLKFAYQEYKLELAYILEQIQHDIDLILRLDVVNNE